MDSIDLLAWQFLNIVIAIFPSILLCIYIYKMDVIEKEPMSLLLKLFFLGIIITIPVAFIESVIIEFFHITEDNIVSCLILAFSVIALIEEGYKFIILRLKAWNNKNFNHIYDAIVYAVFISLGFATLENILYVAKPTLRGVLYFVEPSVDSIMHSTQTGLMRALVSVPAHAFYAISSGYYLGLAKLNYAIGAKKKANKYMLLSILIPIFLHGTFDFLILIGNEWFSWTFYCFITALYIASYYNIKKVSSVEMTINLQRKEGQENENNIKE